MLSAGAPIPHNAEAANRSGGCEAGAVFYSTQSVVVVDLLHWYASVGTAISVCFGLICVGVMVTLPGGVLMSRPEEVL